MTRIGIFLIAAALVAGMVGCTRTSTQYTLTIFSSTGGSVTTPGEGAFTYAAGTKVELVAEPMVSYRFAGWAGDVAGCSDPTSARTTCYVTGNFTISAVFLRISPMAAAGE
jgi:hypothetical protein